jgi:signal transduction histidine kinase
MNVRGLMHDLGHQMMTLSLLADSVCEDGALPSAARHRMEIVKQEIFRILQLIADFAPSDAATARAERVDIRAIAGEAAQLAGLTYDTGVTVEPGGPAVISINPSILRRVLRNLVDNAVRAAGPSGQVLIRVEQTQETVLEIADTGPGFGLGPSGATGLGLTVVRNLLDAVGGRLDVATDPGGGARVQVTFSPDAEYS